MPALSTTLPRQQGVPTAPPRPRRAGLYAPALEGGRPDILAPAVTATAPGVPYRPTVRIAWGADLSADPGSWIWTDVTADLLDDDDHPCVTITRGRGDEATQTQPTTVTFWLDSRTDARYMPRNPLGAYWPYVRQNTPIWVSMNDGSGERTRAFVYADSFEPAWDDLLNTLVVKVSASGLTRQLDQGKTVRSPLRRALAGQSAFGAEAGTVPVTYWAFEDESGSTSAAEDSGGIPITPSGTINWATSTGLASSASLPTVGSDTLISAPVPTYTSAGGWAVVAVLSVPAAPAATITLLEVLAEGTVPRWRARLTSSLALSIEALRTDGVEQLAAPSITLPSSSLNTPLLLRLAAWQDGALTRASVMVLVGGTSYSASSSVTLTTPRVTRALFQPGTALTGAVFGHLAVYNTADPSFVGSLHALAGWAGETPAARFRRICGEEMIPKSVVGSVDEYTFDTTYQQTMGAQLTGGILDVLRECEAVGGVLTDGLRPGLTFLPQVVHPFAGAYGIGQAFDCGARYNRAADLVLDMSAGKLSPPFEPIEDDQRRRNDWKVTRSGATAGSSGRLADTTSSEGVAAVGRYEDSTSVNLVGDAGLVDQAGWRTHLGTVPSMRYPAVVIDLRRDPDLITQWLACDIGSRGTVQNLPAAHPPGDLDLVIEGYTELLRTYEWSARLTCTPYRPWEVQVVGDARLGRWDTGGSTLATDAAVGASSLSVSTPASGVLWTTTATFPADFPMDVEIAGIRVRVTGITGASSPQTFTVDSSTVTKALPAGSAVNIWHPGVIAL